MAVARALDILDEFTVVLPQRHRARVLGVAPHGERAIVILLQDFDRDEAGELTPVWRLYRYDPPEPIALELCRFTRGDETTTGGAVHMAAARDALYVLFDRQLLRVYVDARKVAGVCRIRLPEARDGGKAEIRAMAASEDLLALSIELDEEELTLNFIPLDDGDPTGARFVGTRGERLAFGSDGTLYALDLLEVSAWHGTEVVARRDLEPAFDRWYETPVELLAVTDDGRVVAGAGTRLLALPADLDAEPEILELPDRSDGLVRIPGTGKLLSSRVDEVSATLLLQTFEA